MKPYVLVLSLALSLAAPGLVRGQTATLPSGFYLEEVAPGETFDLPVATEFAPDGRVFIAEKAGRVMVVENGVKLPVPFIDLREEVMDHHDRGLLSIALDPDFVSNGYMYLLYTFDRDGTGDHSRYDVTGRLTRYAASTTNPNVADLSTRKVLIGETYASAIPSCFYSHAVGTVRFGNDGSLFVSAGDGAWYTKIDAGGITEPCFVDGLDEEVNDIGSFRSISNESLAGKVLRIDPETGQGLPSNPFYTGNPDDTESKVWASGLRNPYRLSVAPPELSDDSGPGMLFISDVGWLTWEEINVARDGGENFGWPCYEGVYEAPEYHEAEPAHHGCETMGTHTPPTYWFKHQDANLSFPSGLKANAIVVGDIYAGTKYPLEYHNRLFYTDYTRGWVASAAVDDSGALDGQWVFGYYFGPVVDWRYNPYDEYFYFVNVWTGNAMRLRHSNENRPPVAVAHTSATAGLLPFAVDFSSTGSYDPDGDPVTVTWEFGDGSKSKLPNPSHTYANEGTYVARLRVTDPNGASTTRSITISAGNTLPEAIVHTPDDRAIVSVDDVLSLMGTGLDAQDNAKHLSYAWKIIARHNNHYHPDIYSANTRYTEYVVEEHGVPEEVNYLEVKLIVTDAGGLTDTTTRYVEIRRVGEADVTSGSIPIALAADSVADDQDLGVISDGVMVIPGSPAPPVQYDTNTGTPKSEDWIGYEFEAPVYLSRLELQEGAHSPEGGWFDDFRVEVRAGDEWQEVQYLSSIAPYHGADNGDFGTYSLQFRAIHGDAIRIIGTPGGTGGYISVSELRAFALPSPPKNHFESILVGDVSADAWTTVGLRHEYGEMVAVCSVAQAEQTTPLAVRMRAASGSSFQIMLQSPDSTATVVPETVHCAVTSAGEWTLPDGTRMRAGKYTSTTTDRTGDWAGQQQEPPTHFDSPVVVGQVMSFNDPQWSTFWARGPKINQAPTTNALFTGKHVASDSTSRVDEIVGYIVFESTHVEGSQISLEAQNVMASGDLAIAKHVQPFATPFATAPAMALVSSSGMPEDSGVWPVLAGTDPVRSKSLSIGLARTGSAPDSSATARVSYVALGSAAADYQLQVPPTAKTSAGAMDNASAPAVADRFEVTSVFPNPFEEVVNISFTVPEANEVSVEVFDVLGRHVSTVLRGRLDAGVHDISWAGTIAGGASAAPGVYFLVLRSGDDRIEQMVVRSR